MKTHGVKKERGATLVEFAIVLPLFLLLLFGIMETGWFFAQQVEMKNATREGARLAVVDFGTGEAVVAEACSRADLSSPGTLWNVTKIVDVTGDSVLVDASKPYQSLTGFIDSFSTVTISSSTEMRTERTLIDLTNVTDEPCP